MSRNLLHAISVPLVTLALVCPALILLPSAEADFLVSRPLEIRGVSLAHLHRGDAGYGSDDCREQLAKIRHLGASWVALTDFAYMHAVDQPTLHYGMDDQLSDDHTTRAVADAQAAGLKVLLKPHIWSRQFGRGGKWHGDIKMTSDADWKTWFDRYRAFVLAQADLAQQTGADALSIGCELEGTTKVQAHRWRELIADVRKIYRGQLTYSAAFLEWKQIDWWDQLDFIGITAYMPLTDAPDPTDRQLRLAWRRIYDRDLGPLARKWNKPICFTEIGYSASRAAAREPWKYDIEGASHAYQARLLGIALEEASKRPYMRGAFVWKWFTSDRLMPQGDRTDPFTIQNRPEVVNALREGFRTDHAGAERRER